MQALSLEQLAQAALQFHGQGKLREAEMVYRQLLAIRPDQADVHFNLGCALQEMGRLSEALGAYESARSLRPDFPAAQTNRGMVLHKLGRLNEALAAFAQVIRLHPDNGDAHYLLGRVLEDLGRLDEANESFRRAVASDASASATNRGNALHKLGRIDQAIEAFQQVLQSRPMATETRLSLGNALQQKGDLQAAMAEYRRAIEQRPAFAEAYVSLAGSLQQLGQVEGAITACRRAIEIRPDYPQARWNLGLLKLLKGEFEEGWELYESRLRFLPAAEPFQQPRWNGSELLGRRILLHAEQGFGDTIQFVRYAPLAAARGGRVIVRCQAALKRLLLSLSDVEQVVSDAEPLPEFDVHLPLMSLPGAFGTRLDNIPASVPYLFADGELARHWGQRLAGERKKRVGLVWAGSRQNINDRNRSIDPAELAILRGLPNVRYISLQKREPWESTLRPSLEMLDWTTELEDFAATAALIENLDLVISVDTAVAHLAGALGKPVWLLVPVAPDWRWMLHREDSPWYPTMRLFRQPARGNWRTPLERIARELRGFACQT